MTNPNPAAPLTERACGDCGHDWSWHIDWPGACSECVCQAFLFTGRAARATSTPAGLRKAVEAVIWEHGLFIDWEAQTVSCGCGRFAGTMPFMEHVLGALRAALQGADR